MKWSFLAQAEDQGRMTARVLQVLDRQLVSIESFSLAKLDGRTFLSFLVEADEKLVGRVQALLRKIEGMDSVMVIAEAGVLRRMIALFRVRCDIFDRNELLHFISALGARALMIRPLWVAFEVIGTPCEVEGIYQSAMGYGLVDLVSFSCAFMTSDYEIERTRNSAGAAEMPVARE
jgi:acetolactate synthase small subunit